MKLACQKRLSTISIPLAIKLPLSVKMAKNVTDNLVKEQSVTIVKNALMIGKHVLEENAMTVVHWKDAEDASLDNVPTKSQETHVAKILTVQA